MLHLQEPRAPIAPDNSPPEETCTEAGVETGGAHVKGILKQSRFYRDQEVEVTMATERANGIHSQGLGAVNRKDNRAQVAEEECLVIVQTDREYTLDWAAVFGQSLFQDSPRPSPYPFWRSRSSSPTRTSPPVIERSHIHLERDKESDFFARVEALLRQPEQPEGDGELYKRAVSLRGDKLVTTLSLYRHCTFTVPCTTFSCIRPFVLSNATPSSPFCHCVTNMSWCCHYVIVC